jgi:cytochrome P450
MNDEFDPYAPSSDDRYAAMAQVRASGGVVETPAGYYIATAAGVSAGLQDVAKFVGSFMDTSALDEDDVMISAIPEPRHGRIRRVINTVVAAHRTMQNEPFIRERARELVGLAVDRARQGTVDLVEVFDPLPSIVIAHMLGVPEGLEDRFRVWSDELLEAQNARGTGALSDAHPEFARFVQGLIDDHRAMDDPPDDVVTRFIATDVDGEYLSDRAVRTQIMFLIVAGNETTRNLIGNCLYVLATRPDLFELVRAQAELIAPFVEESLRLDAPVQVLARSVLDDTEILGCPLHVGDKVVFGVASANRDEAVYDDPTEFRLDRTRMREHLAFGTGPHVCPGASLARLEAAAVVEELCGRVTALRLADGYVPDPNPVFWANGHRSLPAVLTPSTSEDARSWQHGAQ